MPFGRRAVIGRSLYAAHTVTERRSIFLDGPWGVSLGPGSARLVADAVLGRGAAIAPELAAARF